MCLPSTSNFVFSTKGLTIAAPSSSIAMPSRVNPLSEYFCWNWISDGISARHGSHQVAQKLTSTTFPFRLATQLLEHGSFSETSVPCEFWKATLSSVFGAVLQPERAPAAVATPSARSNVLKFLPIRLLRIWKLHYREK